MNNRCFSREIFGFKYHKPPQDLKYKGVGVKKNKQTNKTNKKNTRMSSNTEDHELNLKFVRK